MIPQVDVDPLLSLNSETGFGNPNPCQKCPVVIIYSRQDNPKPQTLYDKPTRRLASACSRLSVFDFRKLAFPMSGFYRHIK